MTDALRSTVQEPSGRGAGDDLPALHAREIDRLVAYLFSSDRGLGMAGAEAIAQQAFLELRGTWPGTGGHPNHQVHLFAAAQRIASTWPHRPGADVADPLKDSAPAYWDRADVTRLTVLQDGLDRLPDVPRRVVLLREMCGFTAAEAAAIISVPETAAENARGDGLRSLVPMIDSGTSTGLARRGPLVPEDFGALARVLQTGDGRVAAERARFASALNAQRGAVTQPAPVQPPPGRLAAAPTASTPSAAPAASTPSAAPAASAGPAPVVPSAMAATVPPGATVLPGAPVLPAAPAVPDGAGSDITQLFAAPAGLAQPALGPQPPLGPQAFVRPAPSPGAPLAPSPVPPAPVVPPGPTGTSGATTRFSAPPVPPVPPAAPQPQVTQPQVTQPQVTQPQVTQPQVTQPMYQAPPAHAPAPRPASDLDSTLIGGPASSLVSIGTPIFDSVSAWFSSGTGGAWASLDDAAWQEASRRAAAAPAYESSTAVGLPRRRPGANTVPSASEARGRATMFGPPSGQIDAGSVRARLGGFQDGLISARRFRDEVSEPIAVEAAEALEAAHHGNGSLFTPGGSSSGSTAASSSGPSAGAPAGAPFTGAGSGQRPRFQAPQTPSGATLPRRQPARPVGQPAPGPAAGPAPARPAARPGPSGGSPGGRAAHRPDARAADAEVDRRPRPGHSEGTPPFGAVAPGVAKRAPEPAPAETLDGPAPGVQPGDRAPRDAHGPQSRQGEARGFGVFYRDYLPQLLALLMVEGARPALAAEIAQDVMSAAYREWARIDTPRDWTRERALAALADRRGGAAAGGS